MPANGKHFKLTVTDLVLPAQAGEAFQRSVSHAPRTVFAFAGLAILAGLLTANPLLTTFAVAELAGIVWLLWRPGEPPVLVFVSFYQWLQASLAIFYTDFYGVELTVASNANFVRATWLSLFGIMVFVLGVRTALTRMPTQLGATVDWEVKKLSIPKLFTAYFLALGFAVAIRMLAQHAGGLQQPLQAMANAKWIVVFLLMLAIERQQRHFGFLAVVLVLEAAIGVLGYFSSFKEVFFVLGIVLLSSPQAMRLRRVVVMTAVVAFVIALGIIWSVIKPDYREFLNQGTGEQVVLVSVPERVQKLRQLASTLDRDSVERGIEELVLRINYVQYFALCLEHVPSTLPYEDGRLWLGAFQHVFMPRIFFPDKPVINDSDRTSYYTGVTVAGEEQGTSISIGYMAESYIDFGTWLMWLPAAALGLYCGLIYRFFALRSRHKVLGLCVASTIIAFSGISIEQSNIKLVGGSITSLLALTLLTIFFAELFWSIITETKWRVRPRRRPTRSS